LKFSSRSWRWVFVDSWRHARHSAISLFFLSLSLKFSGNSWEFWLYRCLAWVRNAQVFRCWDAQVLRWWDAEMLKCSRVQMLRCSGV
jgi:hypothetical protein